MVVMLRRCSDCGQFLGEEYDVYTPFGSYTDLEPPDDVEICLKCAWRRQVHEAGLLIHRKKMHPGCFLAVNDLGMQSVWLLAKYQKMLVRLSDVMNINFVRDDIRAEILELGAGYFRSR